MRAVLALDAPPLSCVAAAGEGTSHSGVTSDRPRRMRRKTQPRLVELRAREASARRQRTRKVRGGREGEGARATHRAMKSGELRWIAE